MSETGDQMASAFATKLAGLTSTSQSIETLSHWCVFHRKRAKILAPAWQRELRAAPPKRKLSFLYLANDVMQNSRKKGSEWIEALWPIMSWATRHTLRNTGDDKTQKSCAKLVKVWQDRKIFGSRSLDGWLDADDDETDVAAAPTAAATNAPPPIASAAPLDAAAPGGPARRREERLAEVPAALTGANAALALAMETAETAAAALAVADAACAADLKEEILADCFLDSTEGDAEAAKRAVQAAESALSARRAALEEAASASEEVARLAEEARRSHEEKAREASEALEASAQIAVKVATLRMKTTKRAAAAMAKAVAEEARNRDATPAAAAAAEEEEPYVPE
jgi:regulator of Ty1 transposition protein 103